MNTIFDDMLPSGSPGKILSSLILLLFIILTVSFLKRYLTRYIKDRDARYYARKYISFFGYTVGFLLLVSLYSDRLGRFTVIFGVAGAGIAFALQEVIASVGGWAAVTFSSFYKIGDRVQLGGIKGDVIDIGVLRTTIMECGEWVKSDLYTGRIVRVANSFVFKEPVYNYSGDFPFLWDEITIPVKHGADAGLVKKILLAIAEESVGDYAASARESWGRMVSKYRIEDAKIDPAVTLVVTDNWLEFSVRYVVDYKKRRSTKDALFIKILEEFAKYPEKMSIASTTVHLVAAPTLDVRIREQHGRNS
jgi:small-conductance mechanosensitive channel